MVGQLSVGEDIRSVWCGGEVVVRLGGIALHLVDEAEGSLAGIEARL